MNGVFEKTNKGCPQGSPLSQVLSKIVLNELDHKLEERNLGYCRWADDFVIVVRSERAAHRMMQNTILYLEQELGLEVNSERSQVAPIKKISFLGFSILRGKIRVSTKAQLKFKVRVRELTHRNNPLSMYQVIHQLSVYLRGWVGYFGIQEFKYLFRDLDAWIRRCLDKKPAQVDATEEMEEGDDSAANALDRLIQSPIWGLPELIACFKVLVGISMFEEPCFTRNIRAFSPGRRDSDGQRRCTYYTQIVHTARFKTQQSQVGA